MNSELVPHEKGLFCVKSVRFLIYKDGSTTYCYLLKRRWPCPRLTLFLPGEFVSGAEAMA